MSEKRIAEVSGIGEITIRDVYKEMQIYRVQLLPH